MSVCLSASGQRSPECAGVDSVISANAGIVDTVNPLNSRLRGSDGGGDLEFEERWTGGYIFENEWQSFRTRKNRSLELNSAPHTYTAKGPYTVAVKVIDIFGNDTLALIPVNVG